MTQRLGYIMCATYSPSHGMVMNRNCRTPLGWRWRDDLIDPAGDDSDEMDEYGFDVLFEDTEDARPPVEALR